MIGKSVTGYRIVDKLGEGGMGEVYLAEDDTLHRRVALKFLTRRFMHDQDARERFLREARSAASLNHPNIVTIFGFGEFEDQYYIAMELIEGISVAQLIRNQHLQIEQVADIATQLCTGISEAHRNGIIHRDIKPRNLMINPRGQLKILDFGIAKLQSAPEFTGEGATLGTLHYLSPEQIGDKKVDQRSDIFSTGIVLYEMLTGQRPFTGGGSPAILNAILNVEPRPLSQLRPDIPADIEAAVHKALQKDPSRRFQRIDLLANIFGTALTATLYGNTLLPVPVTAGEAEDDSQTRQWISLLAVELLPKNNHVDSENKTLKIHRTDAQLVKDVVASFDGELIESRHNIFCFRFAATGTAARCAIEIARRFDQNLVDATAGGDVIARMALEMGEIVEQANHRLVEGLNTLTAMLTYAQPGGVVSSENTLLMLGGQFDQSLEELGERQLNGLGESINITRLITGFEDSSVETKIVRPQSLRPPTSFPTGKNTAIYLVIAALAIVISLMLWFMQVDDQPSAVNHGSRLLAVSTPADSAFLTEVGAIKSADSLQAYLNAGKAAGRWNYGSSNHFSDRQGKFVLVVTGKHLERVFKFDNGYYVDAVTGEKLASLSPAYSGSIAVWTEIFEETGE